MLTQQAAEVASAGAQKKAKEMGIGRRPHLSAVTYQAHD